MEEPNYKLIRQVGSGLAGVVWAADGPSGRVAMRRFGSTAIQGSEDWQADRSHFLQGARQSMTLRNPRIVSVLDVVDDGADMWIAAEFVQDETLDALLKRERLPVEQTSYILRSIALALDHAHRVGVPHGDLKPSNIFVGEKRTVRLADFAISPRARRNPRAAVNSGWVHPYLSPEHLISPASIGAKSDQYSLAALAYRMYTGKAPFAPGGGDPGPAILRGQVAPPSTVNKNLPAGVDIAILKALSRDPGQRFSTCIEFIEHLEAGLVPTAAPSMAAPGSSPRLMYAGLGSLVVALAIAAALLFSGSKGPKKVEKTEKVEKTAIPPATAPATVTATAQKVVAAPAAPAASRKNPFQQAALDTSPRSAPAAPPVAPQPSSRSTPNDAYIRRATATVAETLARQAPPPNLPPQHAPPAQSQELVLPPPAGATIGYSLAVFSRDSKHPIAEGISFGYKDPVLGEMGSGDLKAQVILSGPPGKGKLSLEWDVDGTMMDARFVNPNTLAVFHNEPIPGTYHIILRQDAKTVAEYKFRIAP